MLKKYFYLIFILSFTNCSSPKKVLFQNYIDTTNRLIETQEQETFQLDSLGVFASNNFDGARLNEFKKLNDTTAIALITPENTPINNSPYYAFQIWSKEPKTFYVNLRYPKGFKHRYTPKLKVNGKWKKIDSINIFTKDSLTFIKLKLSKTKQIVAAQKIESSKDVNNWIQKLSLNYSKNLKVTSAGASTFGRNLPVLIITNNFSNKKNVIVLLTRQHPPEVTGYYAFKNFIETILKENKLSNTFLDNYQIIAFPIMNPDGVDLGHWRHNAGGVDLNRDWSRYNQPEIKQTVNFINKFLKRNDVKVILGLDFHSTWYDIFYTNKERKKTSLPNFINEWFSAIENTLINYKVNESSQNSKKPVSKGWFLRGHNATGVTFEIGDTTSEKKIKKISRIAAIKMTQILLNK